MLYIALELVQLVRVTTLKNLSNDSLLRLNQATVSIEQLQLPIEIN